MIKLIRIPAALEEFFSIVEQHFNKKAFIHFQSLCTLMAVSEHKTINKIVALMPFSAHRTNCNEFVKSRSWNEEIVLQELANRHIRRLLNKSKNKTVFAIIDDSKKKKVGKNVQGAGKIFDPVFKKYVHGHQILTLTLYFQGMTIPYGIKLYLKQSHAKDLKVPFKKLSELAADLIGSINLPNKTKVYVLTDSYYVNQTVVNAAKNKGFHFIGTLKTNRTFLINGRKTSVAKYIKNSFRRNKKDLFTISNHRNTAQYRYIKKQAYVSKIGNSQIVFSQKNKHKKVLPIICTDINLDEKEVIRFYCFRWSIEVWFKNLKQHLGFGAMHRRVLTGVVKHLHLSACAYMLLTHLLDSSEKGKSNTSVVQVSIPSLQDQLKSILLKDTFDAMIHKFNLGKGAINTIDIIKATLFDDKKLLEITI